MRGLEQHLPIDFTYAVKLKTSLFYSQVFKLKNKKIKEQHHKKELLSSFHLNGHSLEFHPQTQKLGPSCTTY